MKKLISLFIISIAITTSIFSSGATESKINPIIQVYAGAGTSKPVKLLVEEFERESDINVTLTLANVGQILSQINTSKMGDVFICASTEDLKSIESSITQVDKLAKHEISFAVAKGNPKNIKSLEDLKRDDVKTILGNSSTIAGKTANAMLKKAGILDDVNVIARQTTAILIYTALERGECDAIITWTNNLGDNCEIVDKNATDKYTKAISSAALSFTENPEAQQEFLEFLKSETASKIWEDAGYERI